MDLLHTLGQLVINGILQGGVYAVMASGLALVFGVLRVLQISHTVMIILGCYLSYTLSSGFGWDPFLALLITAPLMFGVGAFLYRFIVAPLQNAPPVAVLLAFFGVIMIVENAVGLIWSTNYTAIRSMSQGKSVLLWGVSLPLSKVLAFGAAVMVMSGLFLFLKNTETGRAIRAVSQDRRTAQVLGVDLGRVFVIVFGISTVLAAVGGSLMGVMYSFYPSLHWQWLGVVFSVVVLGGLGSVSGASLAAIIIGTAESLAAYYLGSQWGPFMAFAILVVTLVLRPHGLFGEKGARL